MKIVVTGASGLLGRAICKHFKSIPRFEVKGIAFSRAKGDHVKMDLTDEAAVTRFMDNYGPDIIIHAAAERRPDVCKDSPDEAEKLNVGAVKTLARCAESFGIWLVYISTDYVFDGKNPPYYPGSKPNPLNFYGKTKLAGEKVVKKILEEYCILRLPILYGFVEYPAESAVNIIAGNLLGNPGAVQDNWAVRYPTFVDDIAVVLQQMIEIWWEEQEINGIYHWSGDEAFTKYGMALVMADILGIDPAKITGDDTPTPGAPRPYDAHLDSGSLEKLGIGKRTPFRDAMKRILGQ